MAKVRFYLAPKDEAEVPPARRLARTRRPSEPEPSNDDHPDEVARRQAGIEARRRLALEANANGVKIIWVPDDRWTTIRTAPADGIKLEARSIKFNGLSQVNFNNPGIIEGLLEHAEHEIGAVEPCMLFWAEFRFSRM